MEKIKNILNSNNLDADFFEMERKKKELYNGKDKFKFFNQVYNFCSILRKKFPDYNQYRFYHSLIGSTVEEKDIKKNDFPGKYSIKNFIEEKFNEM